MLHWHMAMAIVYAEYPFFIVIEPIAMVTVIVNC